MKILNINKIYLYDSLCNWSGNLFFMYTTKLVSFELKSELNFAIIERAATMHYNSHKKVHLNVHYIYI